MLLYLGCRATASYSNWVECPMPPVMTRTTGSSATAESVTCWIDNVHLLCPRHENLPIASTNFITDDMTVSTMDNIAEPHKTTTATETGLVLTFSCFLVADERKRARCRSDRVQTCS